MRGISVLCQCSLVIVFLFEPIGAKGSTGVTGCMDRRCIARYGTAVPGSVFRRVVRSTCGCACVIFRCVSKGEREQYYIHFLDFVFIILEIRSQLLPFSYFSYVSLPLFAGTECEMIASLLARLLQQRSKFSHAPDLNKLVPLYDLVQKQYKKESARRGSSSAYSKQLQVCVCLCFLCFLVFASSFYHFSFVGDAIV